MSCHSKYHPGTRRCPAPDGHDHWTVRLLADKAVEPGYVQGISRETVRQLIKYRCAERHTVSEDDGFSRR
jgi:hypothetical protein